MRLYLLAFVACFFPLVIEAKPVPEKKETLAGWGTLVDPDNDCKAGATNGKLTLTLPKTWHDLTHTDDYTKINAPRVLKDVKGDFRVQVKVNEFIPPEDKAPAGGKFSFRSAGLLIWQSDKNFIRMERAAVPGAPFIWVEGFQDGKSAFQAQTPVMGAATKLRVERKGNKLIFSTADGATWNEIHSQQVELPQELKVGVLAINTTAAEFTAVLEDLDVGARPE